MKRFILAALLPLALAGCSPRLGAYQSVGYAQGKFAAAARSDQDSATREVKDLLGKFAAEREANIWSRFHGKYAGVANRFAAAGQSIPPDQVMYMLAESWEEQDRIQSNIAAQRAHILSITSKLSANANDWDTFMESLEQQRVMERQVQGQQIDAITQTALELNNDLIEAQSRRAFLDNLAKQSAAAAAAPPEEHLEEPPPAPTE